MTNPIIREREARQRAYLEAAAIWDAAPDDRRAEARVNLALHALSFWNDPVPVAPSADVEIPSSTTPEDARSLSRLAGVVETMEGLPPSSGAFDTVAGESREEAEVNAIARRIAAA